MGYVLTGSNQGPDLLQAAYLVSNQVDKVPNPVCLLIFHLAPLVCNISAPGFVHQIRRNYNNESSRPG